ncbi:uncharacterized protein DUF4494 [Arcicella aurantiaca]|uniref:Uncharacterized protein DUF4494 n=1 Tax=Arcicella aurantiaca TaxID=591202 RepID=A0A316E8W8_9BACT|nr:DUF4494 domain-containing protein [Arcicella aurantiaca]PWK27203.1 uncharacterized protein DUF4494 [Arcicella aurantiaca]
MANWYVANIRFQREDDSGALKTINETYLIDGVSYTEAEARVFEVIVKNTPDFQLIKLSKMKLSEVFFDEDGGEIWYKIKVMYISFDEKTAKEKKTPHMMLVNGENPMLAYSYLSKQLGTLNDYQITDVNITPILEIYPYTPEHE